MCNIAVCDPHYVCRIKAPHSCYNIQALHSISVSLFHICHIYTNKMTGEKKDSTPKEEEIICAICNYGH